ncbi:chaperonin 10-like protein [Podospora didyma]|uniref:Chaperonin 10-like protein n=1 Tax=Podospora didyma TaxID=330526 RepID=A0AAE0NGP1_9PEZI|nr:chaperonin 10-like protein [Podospora didyma]
MAPAVRANKAVWQDTFGVKGEIRDRAATNDDELGDHKVLVKVEAWAINPCDYMLQDRNMGFAYPVVLGCDVAGTVEAVTPGSSAAAKFKVGDRVFGMTANNGFQDYVAVEDRLISKIPDGMAFREPVVLGLCVATSALFLFGEDYLNLSYPKIGAPKKGKSVLVWGGSSAVGSNAIQLTTAAGYDVIATCSKNNFDYVKGLGAVAVFDYKDPDVTEKLAAELDKGECAGILMAAGLKDGNLAAWKVAAASKQKLKFASSSYIDNMDEVPKNVDVKQLAPANFKPMPDCWFEMKEATFEGYLPEALAKGVYKIAPPPLVISKKGLEAVQEGIDLQRIIGEKGQAGIKEVIGRVKGANAGDKVSPVKLVIERA